MTNRQSKTLVIIDDQFEKIEGHLYEYNKSTCRIFRGHGFETVIYANAGISRPLQEELNARPWFQFTANSRLRGIPLLGPVLYRLGFWKQYRRQMTALLKQLAEQYENCIVFIPNVYWYTILPVMKSLRSTRIPAGLLYRVSIYDTIQIPAVMKPLILPLIKHAVKLVKHCGHIHYYSDSDVIAREWEAAFHQEMDVLPIPHLTPHHIAEPHAAAGNKLRMYLPGSMRIEKGARLLTEGMELLAARYPELLDRIILAVQFTGSDATLMQYRDRLAALPIENNFLGNLSTEAYNHQVQSADVILIPYQASEGYRARTSGILAEAIAAEKPFITTDGTWMAVQAQKYDTGIVIGETPDAFAESIVKLVQHYEHFATLAKTAADKWLSFHSKDNFFRLLSKIYDNAPAGH